MKEYNVMLYGTFAFRDRIKAKNKRDLWDIIYEKIEANGVEIDDIHNDEIEEI